jgi:outer membrane protein insertion porin family
MLNYQKIWFLLQQQHTIMRKIHFSGLFISIFCLSLLLMSSQGLGQDENSSASLVVSSINITGNTKTQKNVILSLLDFKVGDSIDKERLGKNVARLEGSNFFKSVNVYTQPGEEKGFVNVYIEIRERRWPSFQFKSGFNELDGWYISPLGIRFDNFFGRGNYFGAEFLIGDRVTGLDISYLRPNIVGSDLNLGINLFSRDRQFVHYLEDVKYLQHVKSGGLSIGLNANRGLLKYLWFELVRETFTADDFMKKPDNDTTFALPPVLQPFSGQKEEVGRIIISLNVDTRDQVFYPLGGWWGSLALDQVSTQLGAFKDYKRVILDIRRYQALVNDWVIAARIRGGWVDDQAPFYEKFYLGGPNSLRGYKDRSLNPLGYASYLVQGGAEFRFPITRNKFPRQFLTGVLFYDIGEAWNKPDEFDASRLKSSLGYGFRVRVPIIGLVRLDFAYPIPEYEFRVHLSLGHTF